MTGEPLLGRSAQRFLEGFWQKRPLLVRQALPGFRDPLSPEELAGLACEAGVEARLVLERGGRRWEVRHGPFAEADLTALPRSHWTLLVQDVDKYLPEVAALREGFGFIPDWRIDDVMVSYAAPAGSVGPHADAYDVFLVQGQGRRRWRVGVLPVTEADLVPGLELRILERMPVQWEWVLEPGDMLYLPPGLPHHGVAEGPCMTYSVGFRAPSHRELVADFLDRLLEIVPEQPRYGDPALPGGPRPGEIDPAVVERTRRVLRSYLAVGEARLARWIGQSLTDPKPNLGAEPPGAPMSPAELRAHLLAGVVLERHPHARFAYLRETPRRTVLFADGDAFPLEGAACPLAPRLCERARVPAVELIEAVGVEAIVGPLHALHRRGLVHFADE